MEKENTNTNKTDNLCNTSGASQTYTIGQPSTNNYSQYCPHRLPCGICGRTYSMCPFGGSNVHMTPTCDQTLPPPNPITNPQVWYNVTGINEAHSTDNLDIKGQ